ncbi:hypothetical protein EJB05_52662, partial [Eragrostis curvula]
MLDTGPKMRAITTSPSRCCHLATPTPAADVEDDIDVKSSKTPLRSPSSTRQRHAAEADVEVPWRRGAGVAVRGRRSWRPKAIHDVRKRPNQHLAATM